MGEIITFTATDMDTGGLGRILQRTLEGSTVKNQHIPTFQHMAGCITVVVPGKLIIVRSLLWIIAKVVGLNSAPLATKSSLRRRAGMMLETAVVELMGSQTTWIGGSDRETEGTWTWSDGTPWENPLWASGEPNNLNNEDCVILWAKNKIRNTNMFIDERCDKKYYYVCEKCKK